MDRPGLGQPLPQQSPLRTEGRGGNWFEVALPVTVRERAIIAITAALKDKPEWERKVFDETIVSKWRSEAVGGSNIVQNQLQTATATEGDLVQQTEPKYATLDFDAPERQRVITENLFQYVSLKDIRVTSTS
jgi:hypothetical protein